MSGNDKNECENSPREATAPGGKFKKTPHTDFQRKRAPGFKEKIDKRVLKN
jgi:hypothetical protein